MRRATAFALALLLMVLAHIACAEAAITRKAQLNQANMTVGVNTGSASSLIVEKELPNAYLTFPFLPEDLLGLIGEVNRKTNSEESFRWDEAEVDVPGFCFAGTDIRLTNGEINLIKNWTDGKQSVGKRTRTMIQALNEKLSRIGRKARIEYETGKGYRLVSNHE